jgi:hypothetical protein
MNKKKQITDIIIRVYEDLFDFSITYEIDIVLADGKLIENFDTFSNVEDVYEWQAIHWPRATIHKDF